MATDWEQYGRNMTFQQWIKKWEDLNVVLFGEEGAKLYHELDKPRNKALWKLWQIHGFKTVGEFEDWEREHMAEKNAFLERELNASKG